MPAAADVCVCVCSCGVVRHCRLLTKPITAEALTTTHPCRTNALMLSDLSLEIAPKIPSHAAWALGVGFPESARCILLS